MFQTSINFAAECAKMKRTCDMHLNRPAWCFDFERQFYKLKRLLKHFDAL